MSKILSETELTIDEHVQRIRRCLDKTRKSIFETVESIRKCKEEVGEEVFQTEIAARLGMSPSTLNRWIAIGNSQFVMENQDKVPTTFTGLYLLTRLEKKYTEYYPKQGISKLTQLLTNGKIHENTQQNEVKEILDKISYQIKSQKKKEREKKIIGLIGGNIAIETNKTSLEVLISNKALFRCFFVNLDGELIRRWGDPGYFETDIQTEFPLHELRTPSISETVTCLIRVTMKKIDVAIKVLSAFGFNYRDTFVPSSKSEEMVLLDKHHVVVRGERGVEKRLNGVHLGSTNTNHILNFCESQFEGPYLVVFDNVDRSNWSCITK